ncbi:MAG: hypothetical protein CUN50_00095 [Candidatus Thermofonsia Clade 1 bacterium]|uniref:Uncharacterized protein n=1 Tax=Candidatus Thermofonsia Clade 1 bacterium TaxID=2364210 RepID=A0A2M8Q0N4_9CHLR|nr:MAG: hypothetical protein CUN50_00095 [Candidatus Thermofonsia Clade 1 bacterium]
MRKQQAPKDMLISGQAIRAIVQSIEFDSIRPHMEEIFSVYGLPPSIDPDAWYPLQLYYDITKRLNSEQLISIGVRVINVANFPPEIDSIQKAIELLMATHHLNLRNVPEGDGYSDYHFDDHRITFRENTTFPHDLMYGYIYGLVQRYKKPGEAPVVRRTYLNEADPGAAGAIYEITY